MGTKLLITGATGMIGSLLTEELVRRGVEFAAMTRPGSAGGASADPPGVTRVTGDFDDPASLRAALEGVDTAFLVTNSTERTEAQQVGFVEAAAAAGVSHVVYLSQLASRPDSPVRFLRYHAVVEEALQASGMGWTMLRPNLVLQAFLPSAAAFRQGVLPAPMRDTPVSVVDARDIAAVAAVTLTEAGHDGKTYDLTGPSAVTHGQIAAAFGDVIGHPVRFATMPAAEFVEQVSSLGMPRWQAEGLAEDYAHYERGEAAGVSSAIEDVTGAPPRSLADFATDHAAALRGEPTD